MLVSSPFLCPKAFFLMVKSHHHPHLNFFAQVFGHATDSPQVKKAYVLQ